MPKTANVHKLDGLGRIYLPIKLRKALNIDLCEPLVVQIGDDALILRKTKPDTGRNNLLKGDHDVAL